MPSDRCRPRQPFQQWHINSAIYNHTQNHPMDSRWLGKQYNLEQLYHQTRHFLPYKALLSRRCKLRHWQLLTRDKLGCPTADSSEATASLTIGYSIRDGFQQAANGSGASASSDMPTIRRDDIQCTVNSSASTFRRHRTWCIASWQR